MRAMVLHQIGKPLQLVEVEKPTPVGTEVLVRVHACALCRTDLHIIEGEIPTPKLPLILGHQIVGTTIDNQRVGIPWMQKSCGYCEYCVEGKENLCDHLLLTGYHKNGGLAEYCVVEASALYPIPSTYDDLHAAPLLCGGFIGYRAYKMAGNAKRIGFYGFGSSAHILTQIAVHQGREVYAFTHRGDLEKQNFAKKLGAKWAGDSLARPPLLLDAAILFAPSGPLVIEALKSIKKGGVVICAGIHMSPIPSFDYSLLWEERTLVSVAHLTHQDGIDFMKVAAEISLHTSVTSYPLEQANEALLALKNGSSPGSIVIKI